MLGVEGRRTVQRLAWRQRAGRKVCMCTVNTPRVELGRVHAGPPFSWEVGYGACGFGFSRLGGA